MARKPFAPRAQPHTPSPGVDHRLYCPNLRTPWYRTHFFTKVALPFLALLLLLGLGTVGFWEYYAALQADGVGRPHVEHGWESAENAAQPGPQSQAAPLGRPDWWTPVPEVRPWDAFLLATGLPIGESTLKPGPGIGVPWKLQVARVLGLLVLPAAFIILAFRLLRDDLVRLLIWWWGVVPWRKLNVLCGLGWQGHEVARLILAQARRERQHRRQRLAILEREPDNPFADTLRRLGAAQLIRDATVERSLEDVSVRKAQRIFVLSPDDETNCRIVRQLAAMFGAGPAPSCLPPRHSRQQAGPPAAEQPLCAACPTRQHRIVCHASVRHARTRGFLENTTRDGALTVQTFNLEQLTARHLQARRPFCPVLDDHAGPRHAHVVILGWTPMAQALLMHALHLGHFPRGSDLEITVICTDHAAARAEFYQTCPCLEQTVESGVRDKTPDAVIPSELRRYVFPKVSFHEMPATDAGLLSDAFPLYAHIHPRWFVTVYVCVDDGVNSRVLTRLVRFKLQNARKTGQEMLQVFFYYHYPEDFLLHDDADWPQDEQHHVPVEAFGGLARDFSLDALTHFFLDDLAMQVMHFYSVRHNAAFKHCHGIIAPSETIQEQATLQAVKCLLNRYWDDAEEWEHASNRFAADHMIVKLRCLGFNARLSDAVPTGTHARNPSKPWLIDREEAPPDLTEKLEREELVKCLAEAEHRRWCAERLLMGWRPFIRPDEATQARSEKIQRWFAGEGKKARQEKCHIDLVPFADLPSNPHEQISEQHKDLDMIKALPEMLEKARKLHDVS